MADAHWSDRYLTTEHLEKALKQIEPLATDGETISINAAYLKNLITELLERRKETRENR